MDLAYPCTSRPIVATQSGVRKRDFPENQAVYFFFPAGFGAGLAGPLAFAFFLSLPWELLPLAIVQSSLVKVLRKHHRLLYLS